MCEPDTLTEIRNNRTEIDIHHRRLNYLETLLKALTGQTDASRTPNIFRLNDTLADKLKELQTRHEILVLALESRLTKLEDDLICEHCNHYHP